MSLERPAPNTTATYGSVAGDESQSPHSRVPFADEEEGPEDAAGSEQRTLHPVTTKSIWRVHFMLGAAMLLPWNSMISATSYYQSRLASVPAYRDSFNYVLSSMLTTVNVVFLLHATLTSKAAPLTRRLRSSTIFITVLFVFFTVTALIHIPPIPFYYIILTVASIQAAAGGYMNTAVFALAALFGPETMQSTMAGQAAAGVLVSIVQLITTYSSLRVSAPETQDSTGLAAFAFFAFSTVFMLVSLGAHAYVARQRTYRRVIGPVEAAQSAPQAHGMDKKGLEYTGRIARANLIYNFTVALVFIVTLCVFPAITAAVRPSRAVPAGDASLWHPFMFTAFHFLLFNFGDWLGRYMCSFQRFLIWDPRILLSLAVARVIFIPLFLSCNFTTSASTIGSSSDFVFFALVLALGVSSGWLGSLCMMFSADPVHNARIGVEDVDTAATIASFCLVGGLSLGSVLSFGASTFIPA